MKERMITSLLICVFFVAVITARPFVELVK